MISIRNGGSLWRLFCTAFLLFGALAGASYFYAFAEEETKMLSDVTIYLEPPILGDGGTVIILPKQVPVEEWKQSTGLQNPALKDRRLDDTVPIKDGDRRFGAVISDKNSIVQFDYPEGGTFRFRFSPFLGSDYPMQKLGSKLIGVGGIGQDMHPTTHEIVSVGPLQVLHILGTKIAEEDSRVAESKIRVGFLDERYTCIRYEHILACDATEDRLDE